MSQTFDCPACGAPLDIDPGTDPVIRCPYCKKTVVVPEALRVTVSNEGLPASAGAALDVDLGALVNQAGQLKDIAALARSGNRIEAIKQFHEVTGAGLQESKDAVEALIRGEPLTYTQVSTSVEPGQHISGASSANLVTIQPSVAKSAAAVGTGISCTAIGLAIFILLVTIVPMLIAFVQPGGPLEEPWARINPMSFARLTLSFGQEGTGAGRFSDARYVAVDPNTGNIYVGEFSQGRIQVFDPAGKLITQWNLGDDELYIQGLAIDRQNTVYVLFDGDIHLLDTTTGEELRVIKGLESDTDYFDELALAPDGKLVVAYKNETIVRFNANFEPELVIPDAISSVSDDSELDVHLAVDGLGNIYALGTFNYAVFKFDPQGKFINRFGSQGEERGQFTAPGAIAIDPMGRVYISEIGAIEVFDAEGRYLDRVLASGYAYGLVTTDQNELFAVTSNKRVYKFQLP